MLQSTSGNKRVASTLTSLECLLVTAVDTPLLSEAMVALSAKSMKQLGFSNNDLAVLEAINESIGKRFSFVVAVTTSTELTGAPQVAVSREWKALQAYKGKNVTIRRLKRTTTDGSPPTIESAARVVVAFTKQQSKAARQQFDFESATSHPFFTEFLRMQLLNMLSLEAKRVPCHISLYGQSLLIHTTCYSSAYHSQQQPTKKVDIVLRITTETQITIKSPTTKQQKANQQQQQQQQETYSFSRIGALDSELRQLREVVHLPLTAPHLFAQLGVTMPSGVLIHGPEGTGKTLVARTVAFTVSPTTKVFEVDPADFSSREYGSNEEMLKSIFEAALQHASTAIANDSTSEPEHNDEPTLLLTAASANDSEAPANDTNNNSSSSSDTVLCNSSVVLIDGIDLICPTRDPSAGTLDESSRRLVSAFLSLMDSVAIHNAQVLQQSFDCQQQPRRYYSGGVIVIGVTKKPGSLDQSTRRPGRFDREVEIGIPNREGREQILRVLLTERSAALSDSDVQRVAFSTHGFVGADLRALCNEASSLAVQRYTKSKESQQLDDSVETEPVIRLEDLERAQSVVRPSAMREVLVEIPKVRWNEVGGQEHVKQRLREAVEWQLKHRDAFERMGIRPPKGVLLYGPPGCSKTLMAKALATEAALNFIAVKGPELFSKWVGESEKAVREVFRKARAAAPSIIFFDEIDSLAVERGGGSGGEGRSSGVGDRVLSQLLSELDGVSPLEGVTVIAATNRPDIIDKALMRPGRIDRILYVGPPDSESRAEIFAIHLKKMAHAPNIDTHRLAELSAGYSGAEIAAVCREAAYNALHESLTAEFVEQKHFELAIRSVKPRITREMLDFYWKFQQSNQLHAIGAQPQTFEDFIK